MDRYALFVACGMERFPRYNYGRVDGMERQSHATVVARVWAHMISERRFMPSRHRRVYNGGTTIFSTSLHMQRRGVKTVRHQQVDPYDGFPTSVRHFSINDDMGFFYWFYHP
jgi:hypothetical protein